MNYNIIDMLRRTSVLLTQNSRIYFKVDFLIWRQNTWQKQVKIPYQRLSE